MTVVSGDGVRDSIDIVGFHDDACPGFFDSLFEEAVADASEDRFSRAEVFVEFSGGLAVVLQHEPQHIRCLQIFHAMLMVEVAGGEDIFFEPHFFYELKMLVVQVADETGFDVPLHRGIGSDDPLKRLEKILRSPIAIKNTRVGDAEFRRRQSGTRGTIVFWIVPLGNDGDVVIL